MINNKKSIAISLIVSCLILPLTTLRADVSSWIYTGQGLPQRIRTFAIYNNQLYLGQDYGGIYRYSGGTNWTNVCQGCTTASVTSLLVWNKKLYAGRYDGRLYRYEADNKWTDLGQVPNQCGILSMAVYNNELYVGTEDRWGVGSTQIYKYINNSGWQEVGNLPGMIFIITLTVHNNQLYAGGLGNHVWRYNGGNSWTDIGPIGNGEGTYSLVSYQGKLYGNSQGCLYRYDQSPDDINFGYWTEVGCLPDLIYTLTIYKNKIYAGPVFNGHVWRWDNGVWFDTGMAGQGCCYNTVHALIEYNNWLWAGKVDGKIFKYRNWPNQATPID